MSIDSILLKQREYFALGETLNVDFRLSALKKLRSCIKAHEKEVCDALKEDLGKNELEAFMCECGRAMSEINYLIKHTRSFAKEKRVKTPLAQFAAKSFKKPSPYGNTLIMSPWNYPFLLCVDPLANAIAAGNTAIVKPSAYSYATSKIVEKIVKECFDEKYVAVITGGRKENAELLTKKFDFIFFTGSTAVGKEVLRHTAETLTPAVLELGGKSPCIVDSTANIALAAKRIVFGKYINCGQTCVAPDYILCHTNIKYEFIEKVRSEITAQYGNDALSDESYGRIVNEKHFDRLLGLIDKNKVVFGGGYDRTSLKIEPTVMDNVTYEDAVMQEEIFGPIMPVLTFESYEEIYEKLYSSAKPLAFYIFSEDKKRISEALLRCSFGGGCVNDTIIHLATSEMGFGGVGESGMGEYHGKAGFDAFSHTKSIVDKKTWLDLKMRYRPYSKLSEKLIKLFLK